MSEQSASNTLRLIRYGMLAAVGVGLVAYPLIRGRSGDTRVTVEAPGMATAESQLARSLEMYQAGRYQDAITAANESLKLRPGYAEAFNNIGVSWLQLKDYDQADVALKEALRLKPDFQLAKNNLSWLARERAAASAPPPEPNSYEGQLMRSLTSYEAGRFQESVDAARAALKLRPDSPEAYNNIAAGYAAQGKWDEAIENAQQAIRLKPDFELAKNNLAWAQRGKVGLPK